MPNWEQMANQMGQPFGGLPQPQQQPQMDVQALVKGLTGLLFGGVMPPAPGANPAYQPPPASETWKRAVSMGADFAPVIGDIKSGQEAITGKNMVTGEKLGGWERALAGVGALPFIPNVAAEIKAFHGSPYKFDKFSSTKIGTGEGAQAFGHGLYFTSEKDIARHYSKATTGLQYKIDNVPVDEIKSYRSNFDMAKELGIDIREANRRWNTEENQVKLISDYIKSYGDNYEIMLPESLIPVNLKLKKEGRITHEKGEVYSVTLHKGKQPGEYDYLKWDEIVTDEQIGKINAQLKKEGMPEIDLEARKKSYGRGNVYRSGSEIYKFMGNHITDSMNKKSGGEVFRPSDREASAFLLRAGIDGIEYPAGSLSGGGKGGKNYVVFDENAITIEGK